jgi:hypothetical protein
MDTTLSRLEGKLLPFRMDLMLEEGKITQVQIDKFMLMLDSEDEEIENLALIMLQKLRYGYTW